MNQWERREGEDCGGRAGRPRTLFGPLALLVRWPIPSSIGGRRATFVAALERRRVGYRVSASFAEIWRQRYKCEVSLGRCSNAKLSQNNEKQSKVKRTGRGEMHTPLLRTSRTSPPKLYTPLAEVAHAIPCSTYMFYT